jgi:hypothetical protein
MKKENNTAERPKPPVSFSAFYDPKRLLIAVPIIAAAVVLASAATMVITLTAGEPENLWYSILMLAAGIAVCAGVFLTALLGGGDRIILTEGELILERKRRIVFRLKKENIARIVYKEYNSGRGSETAPEGFTGKGFRYLIIESKEVVGEDGFPDSAVSDGPKQEDAGGDGFPDSAVSDGHKRVGCIIIRIYRNRVQIIKDFWGGEIENLPEDAESDGDESDDLKPDGTEPGNAKSDGMKSDELKPDGTKTDNAEPDAAEHGKRRTRQARRRKKGKALKG